MICEHAEGTMQTMKAKHRIEQRPGQPREGWLIEVARDRLGLSQNAAASRAGITGTRWRTLVYGVRQTKDGIPVIGGAKIFARLATVVGCSPEDFDHVRPDVAAELRRIALLQETEVKVKLSIHQVTMMLLNIRGMTDEQTFQDALREIGLLPTNSNHLEAR